MTSGILQVYVVHQVHTSTGVYTVGESFQTRKDFFQKIANAFCPMVTYLVWAANQIESCVLIKMCCRFSKVGHPIALWMGIKSLFISGCKTSLGE